MIPIAKGQTLAVKDEGSGVTYQLAYVTEDREQAFFELQKQMGGVTNAYVEPATKAVDAEHKGKKWAKGERLDAIKEKARELADDATDTDEDVQSGLRISRAMIDFFVVGWEGGPKEMPKFPDDGKPGILFPFGGASDMAEMITQHMKELTGSNVDEVKN
jgi:hypothetical protein